MVVFTYYSLILVMNFILLTDHLFSLCDRLHSRIAHISMAISFTYSRTHNGPQIWSSTSLKRVQHEVQQALENETALISRYAVKQ